MTAELSDPPRLRLNEHPQRRQLNREAHARPALQIAADNRVSYLAYLHRHISREQENWLCRELAQQLGQPVPDPEAGQFQLDAPFGLVRWERHGEFSSFTILAHGAESSPFAQPALQALPAAWLHLLPGNVLVAAHAALLSPGALPLRIEDLAAQCFNGHELAGAEIGDGAGRAYTDFRIHPDGFSRYLLADLYMGRRQAGRMLQRLLELETYRMLALLALPVAKSIAPELAKVDEELAELTGAISGAAADSEPQLLHRLTELAGAAENALSRTDHRFNASLAYYDIVRNRVAELRERRIHGLQPFQQFVQRRLAPAMDTCRAVAFRQRELAGRAGQPRHRAAAHPRGHPPRTAEPSAAHLDGTPRRHAAAPATNRGRPVHRRHHLLQRRPDRLSVQRRQGRRPAHQRGIGHRRSGAFAGAGHRAGPAPGAVRAATPWRSLQRAKRLKPAHSGNRPAASSAIPKP
ncbi:DUF3422 domain-containing protein [Chromobacterium haemolyticum]|nr:DUF3422 domain-containing protein [Chromobacterium haemolyticum]